MVIVLKISAGTSTLISTSFGIDQMAALTPEQLVSLTSFTGALYWKLDPLDFSISIKNYEWKLHKSKLASKSKFFEAMISSSFMEAGECIVTLHDDEPSMVARMILWCYNGRYPVLLADRTNAVTPTLETMLQAGHGGGKDPLQGAVEVRLESILVEHSRAEHMNFLHDARFKQVMMKRPQMGWKMVKGTRSSINSCEPAKGYRFAKSTAICVLHLDSEEAVCEYLGEYECWALSIIKDQSTKAFKIEFGDLDLATAALEVALKHRDGERQKQNNPFVWMAPKIDYSP